MMEGRGHPNVRRAPPRRRNLDARLFELERFYEASLAAAQGPSREETAAEVRERVRAIIASRGVVQQESESLFDALARALGVESRELRAYFMQRAMGGTPVR